MQWTSLEIQNRDHNGYYVRWGGKSRSSQHYSIIICVDETADISQIEVSICLRYVTECIIREIFIGFYPTEATERKCSLWPGPSYALTQQRSSDYVLMGRPTWVVFTVASPHSWLNAVHLKHCTSNAMPICKTWQSRIQCRVSCPAKYFGHHPEDLQFLGGQPKVPCCPP